MLLNRSSIHLASPRSLPSRLARWRYQMLGGLLICILMPYFARLLVSGDEVGMRQLNITLLWSVLAFMFGGWLLRNVSVYPGVESSALLLPTFTISFAIIGLGLAIGRFEYARSQLFASFVLSIAWFYFVRFTIRRYQWMRIGYLPFGAVSALPPLRHISWIALSEDYLSDEGQVSDRFDAIAADLRIDLPDAWERALSDFALEGIPVYHVKHLMESLTGRVELEHLSENSFGSLVPNVAFLIIKRIIDWTVALVAGVVLLPFCIPIGIAVRLTSPGPALFKQQRIGFRGRPFQVYKFRTMRVVAPGQGLEREAAMTQADDVRVTRLGRLLRRSRLDELPQIINILRGEMSWIGPRPEAEVLSRWYEEQIPFYRYRHIVIPGVTGWAQVTQGHVSEIDDVRAKLHYDFYYIKNFSIWMDLLIIGRTVMTVLTGIGSR
jgi:lipopolysaccharide/colanic/teichoic acid biosynthesis glycosyltransferase